MSNYDPSAALYVGARVELEFRLGVNPRPGRRPVLPDGTPCDDMKDCETWYGIIPDRRQESLLMPAIFAQRVFVAEVHKGLDASSLSPATLAPCIDEFIRLAKSHKLTIPRRQVHFYPGLYNPA